MTERDRRRKRDPSDVTDEEWWFAAAYLTLMREDAPQREHTLRDVFDALRWLVKTGGRWRYLPGDFPPWPAVYQRARRVTAASEQQRAQVAALAEAVPWAAGASVELADVDQGDAGEGPAEAARSHGIELCVVRHAEAQKGFVLLPRRRVVARSFA